MFDNYDNPNTFPNIAEFIPQSELGAILVTSRHVDSRTLVLDQSNCFITLQGLERDDAIFLLAQQSETDVLLLRAFYVYTQILIFLAALGNRLQFN